MIIFSVGLTAAGLILGFTKGWSLALAMTAIGPMIIVGLLSFMAVLTASMADRVRSYSASAGYAEQALSAVRVVVAFGMELTEVKTYSKFLAESRKTGIKTGLSMGFMLGFFMLCIYGTYVYAFTIGPTWVEKEYYNDTYDRTY